MYTPNNMQYQKSIENRVSKVKRELDRLSSIITGDRIMHESTLKALIDCKISSSSEANSSQSIQSARKYQTIEEQYSTALQFEHSYQHLGCSRYNFENSVNIESQSIPNNTVYHSAFNRDNPSQQSQYSTNMQTKNDVSSEIKAVDVTIKKVKPSKNVLVSVKKKDESQISHSKGSSKLKNVRSEKKFTKKKFAEYEANLQKTNYKKVTSPACKISMKEMKNKTQNRIPVSTKVRQLRENKERTECLPIKQSPLTSVSQVRGLSSKYHLHLKKEVSMKINDLKVKKMLCQKQSEYLSAALRITKQEFHRQIVHTRKFTQESYLKIFTLKAIVRFFTQFTEDEVEEDFDSGLVNTIESPNKIIKLMMKLPDIIRKKSILSEERCKVLTEEYQFLEQKARRLHTNKGDLFYAYIIQLHHYIDFLLDYDMVHQTKRKNIFTVDMQEFFSDRSCKEKKTKLNTNIIVSHPQKGKDYDTERKNDARTLKRANTTKVLSPQLKKNRREK